MNLFLFGLLNSPIAMIVLLILALLIFGKRLPEVARSLGKGITEFKKGVKGLEDEIDRPLPPPPQNQPPYSQNPYSQPQSNSQYNPNQAYQYPSYGSQPPGSQQGSPGTYGYTQPPASDTSEDTLQRLRSRSTYGESQPSASEPSQPGSGGQSQSPYPPRGDQKPSD